MESEREFAASYSWNSRERVIIRGMEHYLETGEEILVEVEQLETEVLDPFEVAGTITVLAKNACDGGGYRSFVFIKRKEGNSVAAVRQHAALRENPERDNKELQGAPST